MPAVFVRLAGCNLSCRFCDTDYSLRFLASVDSVVERVGKEGGGCPSVIITGGEPTAQAEVLELIEALRNRGRRIHIESNGTINVSEDLPDDVWLTVSPKQRLHPAMANRADEVKLIVDGRVPIEFVERFPLSTPIFLQPEGNKARNVALSVDAVKASPARFRLSLQTHKFIGIR